METTVAILSWQDDGDPIGYAVLKVNTEEAILPSLSRSGHWSEFRQGEVGKLELTETELHVLDKHGYVIVGEAVATKWHA